MNISENFIRRPIATSLIMAGIAMFGVIAYRALPVSDLPQVDYPTITVSASLPGANPDTMASAVATPMERQFTSIAGLDSMISSSSQGSSNITLQFDLSRDIDGATVDVETAIAEAMPLLPPGMPTPPSFRKVNPGDQAIISLFLTSPTLRLSDLDEYAETMVAQRISMVDGVAQVQVFGAAKYAVRVQVDPNKLATRQIGLNEIDAALQKLERQYSHRHALRPPHRLQCPGQRPAHAGLGIPAHDHRLPERRRGAAGRRGARHRQRRGRQELFADLRRRVRDPRHAAE